MSNNTVQSTCNQRSKSHTDLPRLNQDMGSSSPEQPLHYARFHSLCRDYTAASDSGLLSEYQDDDLEFESNARDGVAITHPEEEFKLEVDTATLAYLSWIFPNSQGEAGGFQACSRPAWQELQIELPVLSHDHEVHMENVWARYKAMSCYSLAERLQQEMPDIKQWAQQEMAVNEACERVMFDQRLPISRETALYLGEIMTMQTETFTLLTPGFETLDDLKEEEPVLPLSWSSDSSKSQRTESLLSVPDPLTSASLDAAELREVDQQLFDNMVEGMSVGSLSPALAPFLLEKDLISLAQKTQESGQQSFHDLRMTSPILTRPILSTNDGLENQRSDDPALISKPFSTSSTSATARRELADYLEHTGRPSGELEQEISRQSLIEIDTTLRMSVPDVCPAPVIRPWQDSKTTHKGEDRKVEAWVNLRLIRRRKWVGLVKLERSMSWKPFTYRPREEVNTWPEALFADSSSADYLHELNESSAKWPSCLTKRAWNFDHTVEDDEELRPLDDSAWLEADKDADSNSADPDFCQPISQQQMQSRAEASARPKDENPVSNMTKILRKRKLELKSQRTAKQARTSSLMDTRLRRFLQARNISRNVSASDQMTEQHGCVAIEADGAPDSASSQLPRLDLPVPVISTADRPIQVIASPDFVARRALVQMMQHRLPYLQLVERDTGSSHSQDLVEADITLSPSTGIVVRTLQQLKQKSLPGRRDQHKDFGLRLLIKSISRKYEHLIILVGESQPEDAINVQPLSDRDAELLADFIAWTSLLTASVDVTYVPGGQRELASWLCGHIAHAGYSVNLAMADESRWERLLRCAGANAFAAQVLLIGLDPDSAGAAVERDCGRQGGKPLLALLNMDAQQRLYRCAALLGGNRILRSMHSKIDQKW